MQELVLDDVYDVWFTSFWQTPFGYGILVALALVALIFVFLLTKIIIAYRRGTTKDQALRALKLLAEKVKKNQLDSKKIYQELTGTIKSYSQWRYGMPRGMTDYELTKALVDIGCEKLHFDRVQRVISDAQAVKFGRFDTHKQQVEQDIADIVFFIEETGKQKRVGA